MVIYEVIGSWYWRETWGHLAKNCVFSTQTGVVYGPLSSYHPFSTQHLLGRCRYQIPNNLMVPSSSEWAFFWEKNVTFSGRKIVGPFKYQIGHLEAATRVVYLSPGVRDSSSHYLVGISLRLFPKSLKKLKSKYCQYQLHIRHPCSIFIPWW